MYQIPGYEWYLFYTLYITTHVLWCVEWVLLAYKPSMFYMLFKKGNASNMVLRSWDLRPYLTPSRAWVCVGLPNLWFFEGLFWDMVLGIPAHSNYVPHACAGALVVFLSVCSPWQHAKSARWSRRYPCQLGTRTQWYLGFIVTTCWRTCVRHVRDSQQLTATAECVTQHSCWLSIASDLSHE